MKRWLVGGLYSYSITLSFPYSSTWNNTSKAKKGMPATPIPALPAAPLPAPALSDTALRLNYTYTPTEKLVLTLEPYKSILLPYWRFANPSLARQSSSVLWTIFESYVGRGDFVGADMTRKYVQMGMTRGKRYANHKGGRKYDRKGLEKGQLGRENGAKVLERWDPEEGGAEWEKRREKLEASEVFKEVWERCKAHEGYAELRKSWEAEKKEWRNRGCPLPDGEPAVNDLTDEGTADLKKARSDGAACNRRSSRLRRE